MDLSISPRGAEELKPASILVVEDEAIIADDIERTLEQLGYRVVGVVASGREALEHAKTLLPGLVLMDIKLQGAMDGIEAADRIRRDHDIPVVFLTSHSDEATLARAKTVEPYGYLLKPFEDRELRVAVEVALHKFALEKELSVRERWFSTTLRSLGDAVIATDPRRRIRFMNPVAEKITGWTSAEASGRTIDEVMQLVDLSGTAVPSPLLEALASSFAVNLSRDVKLVKKGGGKIVVDDNAAPIIDAKGSVVGGVVVFRDVTEQVRL